MAVLLIFIVQFLLMNVQNIVVNASFPNNVSNVGEWCYLPSYQKCGENALCLNYTCACEFGSVPSLSNLENCDKVRCKSDSKCQQYFNNTKCDSKQTCSCDDLYKLDPETQTCVKTETIIGKQCTSSYEDCDRYISDAICLEGKCRCPFGYTPTSDQMGCKKIKCITDKNCADFGGAECDYKGDCKCKPNYDVDYNSQKCKSTRTPVGGLCTSSLQCGNYALCLQSTCRCQMGYNATVGDVNCDKARCRKDKECETQFGKSECENGECVCESDYSVDETTQKCSNKGALNGYCSSDYSCGENTYCNSSNRCKCRFGFKASSKTDCDKIYCYIDSQCSNLFANSRCYVANCYCKPFYQLEDQTCKPTSDVPENGLGVAVIVILCLIPVFVIIGCIAICYCCCCRTRRQAPQALPLPRQVIVIDNPMRQRNIYYSTASAQPVANNATNQLYPDLPSDPPPPYNPDYYEPPQQRKQ